MRGSGATILAGDSKESEWRGERWRCRSLRTKVTRQSGGKHGRAKLCEAEIELAACERGQGGWFALGRRIEQEEEYTDCHPVAGG